MNKQEIIDWLLERDYTLSGTKNYVSPTKKRRFVLKPRVLRFECAVNHETSMYSPKQKIWILIASAPYRKLKWVTNPAGKAIIGGMNASHRA